MMKPLTIKQLYLLMRLKRSKSVILKVLMTSDSKHDSNYKAGRTLRWGKPCKGPLVNVEHL